MYYYVMRNIRMQRENWFLTRTSKACKVRTLHMSNICEFTFYPTQVWDCTTVCSRRNIPVGRTFRATIKRSSVKSNENSAERNNFFRNWRWFVHTLFLPVFISVVATLNLIQNDFFCYDVIINYRDKIFLSKCIITVIEIVERINARSNRFL